MYAVIRSGGKQYRVSPGDELRVELLPGTAGTRIQLADVLAVGESGGALRPASGARVEATVLAQDKAAKVLVFHYKRKKQYKKLQGHRQRFTRIRVDEIVPA